VIILLGDFAKSLYVLSWIWGTLFKDNLFEGDFPLNDVFVECNLLN